VTLKSGLEVIQSGTIRKLGCGFLFAFRSNYYYYYYYKWHFYSANSKVQQMRYWQLNRCVFSYFLKTP